jgi:hypothetical protein
VISGGGAVVRKLRFATLGILVALGCGPVAAASVSSPAQDGGARRDPGARVVAQAATCPAGEVMIGGTCRSLGKKLPAAAPAEPAAAPPVAATCGPGEVMIGGTCRSLGKKLPAAGTTEPGAAPPVAATCGPGEAMIGGTCRKLGQTQPAAPGPVFDPSAGSAGASGQPADDALRAEPSCPAGQVRIGDRCRGLGPPDSPDIAPVCGPGDVASADGCRPARREARPPPAVFDSPETRRAWAFVQLDDADGRGTPAARLTFAVPETDDIGYAADCSARPGDSLPRMSLYGDLPDVGRGRPVTVRFASPGFVRTFVGLVLRPKSEEESPGVTLQAATEDPIWEALARNTAISFTLDDLPPATLDLGGIGQPLGRFLAACAAFESRDPASRLILDARNLFSRPGSSASPADLFSEEAGPDSCEELGDVRSTDGGATITVTFTNATGEYRVLDWLDFNGVPVEYARLESGQSYTVQTYTTHPWMVTDGPGNCIERFMPGQDGEVIEITRASPGFGDE